MVLSFSLLYSLPYHLLVSGGSSEASELLRPHQRSSHETLQNFSCWRDIADDDASYVTKIVRKSQGAGGGGREGKKNARKKYF